MGGHVPTAFDVRDRRLVVNEAEAELVRNIFRRFLADRLCTKLVQELSAAGHRTKRGRSFEKGVLYKLLHNRAYVGEVASSARSPIWPTPNESAGRTCPASCALRCSLRVSSSGSLMAGRLWGSPSSSSPFRSRQAAAGPPLTICTLPWPPAPRR
jgi:Recombinase